MKEIQAITTSKISVVGTVRDASVVLLLEENAVSGEYLPVQTDGHKSACTGTSGSIRGVGTYNGLQSAGQTDRCFFLQMHRFLLAARP